MHDRRDRVAGAATATATAQGLDIPVNSSIILKRVGQALAAADSIWVTDVFPAREDPIEGVTGEMVALAAGRAGGHVQYHADVDTMADTVLKELASGDLLLTMGAGSIDRVAHEVVARLEELQHA